MGKRISSYRELRVFQNAMDAVMRIFELTKDFPPEERKQIKDKVRSGAVTLVNNVP